MSFAAIETMIPDNSQIPAVEPKRKEEIDYEKPINQTGAATLSDGHPKSRS
jgi:hypothetical protein